MYQDNFPPGHDFYDREDIVPGTDEKEEEEEKNDDPDIFDVVIDMIIPKRD